MNQSLYESAPTVPEWGVPFETRGASVVQWFRDPKAAKEFGASKRVSMESFMFREVIVDDVAA